MKKRLVVFKVESQKRIMFETYELKESDIAADVGQALIVWFNMTGGNHDGSYRKFLGVEYDQFISQAEYEKTPYVNKNGIYSYTRFRPITVLGDKTYELLKLTDYYGKQE